MSECVKAEELIRVVQGIFSSMMGLNLEPCNGTKPAGQTGGRRVCASVGISGDWNGAILLECHSKTACVLAGAMLGMEPYPEMDEDVKDALGEITNMVAGNFKKTLPGHSALTLPYVIEGSDYSMEIIKGEKILLQSLACNGDNLTFSVIKAKTRNGGSRSY